jgi:hypothetical protein
MENWDILPLMDDILPNGKGLLLMLKVFLDRGAKRDPKEEVVTVGCVVFKPTPYKQFVRQWKRMLKPWGAKSFHSTDFYNGYEEFKRLGIPDREKLFQDDCRRIPEMVGHHIYCARTVSFNPEEFLRAAPPKWIERYGTSVHSHAVQICLIFNGYWREKTCPSESLAYFMESGDPDSGEIMKAVEGMRQHAKTGPVIKISSFTTVDKGEANGTDAADFLAWHWNKYYLDKVKTGQPTNPRKDFKAFVDSTARGKINYSSVTGDALRYFFSLVPLDSW